MFNDIKVFIDSRADLYTEEYNEGITVATDYSKITKCTGNYDELIHKYNIEYLFINKNTNLAKNIFNSDKYSKMYENEICYIIKVNY